MKDHSRSAWTSWLSVLLVFCCNKMSKGDLRKRESLFELLVPEGEFVMVEEA